MSHARAGIVLLPCQVRGWEPSTEDLLLQMSQALARSRALLQRARESLLFGRPQLTVSRMAIASSRELLDVD